MNNLVHGLEIVKRGILDGDWAGVVSGYNMVTGESLEAPAADGVVARLASLTDELGRLVSSYKQEAQATTAPKKRGGQRRKPAAAPAEPDQPDVWRNEWADDGSVPPDPIDQVVKRKGKPPPRPPYREVAVKCDGPCGRTVMVSPSLAPASVDGVDKPLWFCDRCVRR
jgi:hypothetical protein